MQAGPVQVRSAVHRGACTALKSALSREAEVLCPRVDYARPIYCSQLCDLLTRPFCGPHLPCHLTPIPAELHPGRRSRCCEDCQKRVSLHSDDRPGRFAGICSGCASSSSAHLIFLRYSGACCFISNSALLPRERRRGSRRLFRRRAAAE